MGEPLKVAWGYERKRGWAVHPIRALPQAYVAAGKAGLPLARQHRLGVLHVPSSRRMLWPRPCALVATIHDLAPFRCEGKYDWKRRFYRRVVARSLAHRQDEIIAVSQHTRRDILDFFHFPAERLTMIHSGLDQTRFLPGTREEAQTFVARKHGLRQPFFLYVARLEHPAKNQARLIEAFNRFKAETRSDWRLVLGGCDPGLTVRELFGVLGPG